MHMGEEVSVSALVVFCYNCGKSYKYTDHTWNHRWKPVQFSGHMSSVFTSSVLVSPGKNMVPSSVHLQW